MLNDLEMGLNNWSAKGNEYLVLSLKMSPDIGHKQEEQLNWKGSGDEYIFVDMEKYTCASMQRSLIRQLN